MGGAASFLNPEPIADFTDVIAVGEGEILAHQLVDSIVENESKYEILLRLPASAAGFIFRRCTTLSTTTTGLYSTTFQKLTVFRAVSAALWPPSTQKKARCDELSNADKPSWPNFS